MIQRKLCLLGIKKGFGVFFDFSEHTIF